MPLFLKTDKDEYITGISPACSLFNDIAGWLGMTPVHPSAESSPKKMFSTSLRHDEALTYPLRNVGAALIDAIQLTRKGCPTRVVFGR